MTVIAECAFRVELCLLYSSGELYLLPLKESRFCLQESKVSLTPKFSALGPRGQTIVLFVFPFFTLTQFTWHYFEFSNSIKPNTLLRRHIRSKIHGAVPMYWLYRPHTKLCLSRSTKTNYSSDNSTKFIDANRKRGHSISYT